MIKAIIFDIGGVLRENIDLNDFWGDSKDSDKLRKGFGTGKISTKKFIKRGAKLLKISESKFLREYKRVYNKPELDKEVFDIYKRIKVKKYLLSDTNPLHNSYEKNKYDYIFKIANKVFLSYKIRLRKDNVKTFKIITQKIKTLPREILMIDDSLKNLKNAEKAGMNVLLFKNAKQLKQELRKSGRSI